MVPTPHTVPPQGTSPYSRPRPTVVPNSQNSMEQYTNVKEFLNIMTILNFIPIGNKTKNKKI